MIRMLIIGYCYGIRSERRLCEEVELHLAYRWFCRLDLDDQVPDHSTFSVNRHGRFRDSDILRQVFEAVVRACMDAGLVKGEGFAVDASVIEANASRYHGKTPGEIDWSVPERQTRAAAEFLAGLDDEDPDADHKPPKPISPSDPCSAWTAKANKPVQFGYGSIISSTSRTRSLSTSSPRPHAALTRLSRQRPCSFVPNVALGSSRNVLPPIPLMARPSRLADWHPHRPAYPGLGQSSREDGTLSRSDFRWDRRRGVYICPTVRCCTPLAPHEGTKLRYRASKFDCEVLPSRCSAAQMRHHERFPAMFMNMPAT